MAGPQSAVEIGVDFRDRNNTLGREIKRGLSSFSNEVRTATGGFKAVGDAVGRFDQQLERANKRVLALGASVTIVYGTVRAFGELIKATATIEQNLTSINTIFQLSTRDIDRFGKTLVGVARQTGQSLDEVSRAAQEFARQGLSVEETAKRTRDAMILVRLTGIDVSKAVDSMTAAMNTFGKVGLDSTQILNKLVAVDRAFAVSAKDLAEAFARVGSVADDANVSLDQFNGLVTAARQITSREGAVIGNSLKTIFTRLERSSTLEQIEALGVGIRDAAGNALPTIQIFQNLAKTYGTLTRAQQQQVAEMGAGVFQINQFKALLLDLGKANGIAAQATKISTNATNEALVANSALNNTLATSFQNLETSAKAAAGVIGGLAIKPALSGVLGIADQIASAISGLSAKGNTGPAEDLGKYIGESILKGIGNVLAGPGLAFIMKASIGLMARTMSEATRDIVSASNFPRDFIGSQVARMRMPRAAGGYIPMAEERSAISAGVGGAPASARPVYLPGFNRGGGMRGIVANTSEFMVPGAAGGAIYNRDMIRKYGLPPGAIPVAAGGHIPNAPTGFVPQAGYGGDTYDYSAESAAYIAKQQTELAKKAAADAKQRADDFAKAQKEIIAKESESQQQLRALAAQKAADMEKGFALLEKERELNTSKGQLTTQEIRASEAALSATQKLYAQARARGTAFTAPIVYEGGVSHYTAPVVSADMSKDYYASGMAARNAERAQASKISPLARELAAYSTQQRIERAAYARRQAVLGRVGGALQIGGIVGSLGAGFIPEGQGGTMEGQGYGAARGGAMGVGIGASLGSMFGPIGTIAGALTVGLGMAVHGFISKSRKSFDELASELNDVNAKRQQQLSGAGQFRSIQGNISEALSKGRKSDVINALMGQQATVLSQLSPDMVKRLVAARGDEDAMDKIFTEMQTEAMKQSATESLRLGMKGLEEPGKLGAEGMAGLAQGLRAVVGDTGTREKSLLNRFGAMGGTFAPTSAWGATKDVLFNDGRGGNAMSRTAFEAELIDIINNSSLSQADKTAYAENIKKAKDEALLKLVEALSKAPYVNKLADEMTKGMPSEATLKGLRELSASYLMEAERIGIRGRGAMQVSRTGRQLALENPLLSDADRLRMTSGGALTDISDETRYQQNQLAARGRSMLLDRLIASPVGNTPAAQAMIRGLSGPKDFSNLMATLGTDAGRQTYTGLAQPETMEVLKKLVVEMERLTMVEQEDTAATIKSNELQMRELMYRQSAAGGLAVVQGEAKSATLNVAKMMREGRGPGAIEAAIRAEEEANYRAAIAGGQAGFSESGYERLLVRNAATGSISGNRRVNRATIAEARAGSRLVTGSDLENALMGEASDLGRQGNARGSFRGGFSARFEGLKQDIQQLADVGAQVANSLEQSLGNAFGDFVTGAQKGKDAFRSFVLSVLNDSARAFASKAVQSLLGYVLTAAFSTIGGAPAAAPGMATPTAFHAAGGPVGLAGGGRVPALLTGGEYVFGPSAASRLGSSMLTGLNTGRVRKMAGGGALVRGGSGIRDDVPAMLAPGSFVVRKAMTERYGAPFLSALANGGAAGFAVGGAVGTTVTMSASSTASPVRMAGGGFLGAPMMMADGGGVTTTMGIPSAGLSSGGTFNIGVSISDNRTSTTSSTSQPGGGQQSIADRQFGETLAARMKQVALQTLEEQTRMGGMLRRQSLRGT